MGETTVLLVTTLESGGRRETVQEHQLIQFVFENGDARTGPLVFDVPADATGLKLTTEGTEETIDLGFCRGGADETIRREPAPTVACRTRDAGTDSYEDSSRTTPGR